MATHSSPPKHVTRIGERLVVLIMIGYASIDRQVSLRRADWRFLLPFPDGMFEHLVLLGGPEGLAERIIEAGIARRVSLTLPRERSADVVVILYKAQVAPGDIADCLIPGGVLYYEVDRRLPKLIATTPGRLQRWLRDAGLSPTGVYWAAPDFVHCKRYIPIDVPEAFQWYLATLYVAGTPLHRLLETGLQLYTSFRHRRFAALAPCYAVTAASGSNNAAPPSVLGHPAIPLELQRPGLRPVVLTSGQDDGSRAVILPFAPGSRQPIAVFKISTLPEFNANTEREQTILTEIRGRVSGLMRRSIPQPLGLFHYGELTVGVESCAAGRPLLVSSGRWRAPYQQQIDDLRLAAGWLGELHHQAQIDRLAWNDSAVERWVETPLAAYAQIFGVFSNEERLFAEVRRHAGALVGTSLPIVWMHYDFGPWNLYRTEREFTVIDWEFGRNWERDRLGPALYDLLYFVTYWIHVVQHLNDEAAELRGFYELFLAPDCRDKYANAVHQVIAEYMAALDIDRRFLPLMLVYMWIEQALHQFARKRVLGKVRLDARFGNRCVEYVGVMARHVERLFKEVAI